MQNNTATQRVAIPSAPDPHAMQRMQTYIGKKWAELVRTHEGLFLGMLEDEKVPHKKGAPPILYISQKEDKDAICAHLHAVREQVIERVRSGEVTNKKPEDIPHIDVRILPDHAADIADEDHGLLYLPHPYVVPGGRFNETYGWDSAFIVRGLVLDGEFDLAKQMVDNKLYSVRHYGMILNANRSYYLGRSQAPFLTNKVLDIYTHYDQLTNPEHEHAIDWLKSTLDAVESYYRMWVTPPYIHRQSGLSYYNDMDENPGIEVEFSEKGHYEHALEKLREVYTKQSKPGFTPETYQERKDAYYLELYYEPERFGLSKQESESLPLEEKDLLTEKFYRGDRAMRASGFDPSRRFGFFNVDAIHHLPVCLNCLLHIMEREIAAMYRILAEAEPEGRDAKGRLWVNVARRWRERAAKRKKRINRWLWDGAEDARTDVAAKFPGYRDFNFNYQLCEKYDIPPHRNYIFATAFYPLWARVATEEHAADVVKHIYPKLITEHGLLTSNRETGSQWDAPFAWAPLQIIAARGLIRYGYIDEALTIARGFLNTVSSGFEETGFIFEKYNMETGCHKVSDRIDKGYSVNVEGFGWTNAVVLELLEIMKKHGN